MLSGPYVSKISQSNAVEPLPETGLSSASGKMPSGIPSFSVTGDIKPLKNSIIPELLNSFTLKTRAISAGATPTNDLIPSAAALIVGLTAERLFRRKVPKP